MEGKSSAIANGSHLALFMAERYSQLEPPIVKHSRELRVWRFSFFFNIEGKLTILKLLSELNFFKWLPECLIFYKSFMTSRLP